MSGSSVARSDTEVKKIEKVRYNQQKSEEASPEDSYGDDSFDEFQEDVKSILDCSDSEETCEKESSVDDSERDVQRDTSELQLIIDTLETNTKKTSSRTRRCNKTFSDDELRNIERGNSILMKKILCNGKRTPQYASPSFNEKVWNSTVNRRKRQQEIDQHNLVLLKRIQAVKPFGLSHRK